MTKDPRNLLTGAQRAKLRRLSGRLSSAALVARALADTKGGSRLSRGLALVSLGGLALDLLLPAETLSQRMRDAGFVKQETALGSFLGRLLMGSDLPVRSEDLGSVSRIVTWDGDVAALYEGEEFMEGPFVRKGVDLGEVLRRIVWAKGSDLMVQGQRQKATHYHEASSTNTYRLVTMPPPVEYIAEPGLDWYVKRVRAYGNAAGAGLSRGRTFLLRGPTGVGKGVLARNVAQRVSPEGTQTLKIANTVLDDCPQEDVLDFLRWLKPGVLLVDDVDWDEYSDGPLALFEAMRNQGGLVFCTMMTNNPSEKRYGRRRGANGRDGDHYFPGMRPGRLDEVWVLKRPAPRIREKILRKYLGRDGLKVVGDKLPDVVAETKGMTGAYLVEIALRLRVHGMRRWKAEIKSIRDFAPAHARPKTTPAKKKSGAKKKAAKPAAEKAEVLADAAGKIRSAAKNIAKEAGVKIPVLPEA